MLIRTRRAQDMLHGGLKRQASVIRGKDRGRGKKNAYSTHSGTRTYKLRVLTVTKDTTNCMTGYSCNVHKHRLLLHHMHIRLSAVIVWIASRRSLSAVVTLHARINSCYITCTYQPSLHQFYVSADVTSHARIACYYITCIGINCFLITCVRIEIITQEHK